MNKLKKMRLDRGLRQVDLAVMSNVGATTIWLIEQGFEKRASEKTKRKIASALKVSVKDIFSEN